MYRAYTEKLGANKKVEMADNRQRTTSITQDLPQGNMDAQSGVEIYRESLSQIKCEDAGVPSVFVVMGASVSILLFNSIK